jgi:hypothetical protein
MSFFDGARRLFKHSAETAEFDAGPAERQLQKIKIDLIAASTHHAGTLR